MKFWSVVVAVLLVVTVNVAVASERYEVSAFLVEANGVRFSAQERKIIEALKKVVEEKADLLVTEIVFQGKMEKLNFSDLRTSRRSQITVAIFPKSCGFPQIGYVVRGGYFVAADVFEINRLLKKYL